LLGLLVILLPVGSSNLISNANAIASEDEYYSDQYNERYANDEYYGPEKDRSHSYDNDYKSKDSNKDISVSITKNNCINVNNNINGDVIGNVKVGNSQQTAAGNENEKSWSGNTNGYTGDGQNNKDGGFDCSINNNNNNTIIITAGGNATNGGNATLSCEECLLEFMTPGQRQSLAQAFNVDSLAGVCEVIFNNVASEAQFFDDLGAAGVTDDVALQIIECLKDAGVVFPL
jgi:hypothetical protein